MNFAQIVDHRYSVRSFQNTAVDEKKLHPILDAINKAPSAGNLQALEVVVVRDADRKKQLVGLTTGS